MNKPTKKFRVYIDKVYYLVYLWPSLKTMREHRAAVGLPRSDCQACTLLYKRRRGKQIGEMHFVQKWFDGAGNASRITSHEAVHAAFGFLRMADVDFSNLNEQFVKTRSKNSRASQLEEIIAQIACQVTQDIIERLKIS